MVKRRRREEERKIYLVNEESELVGLRSREGSVQSRHLLLKQRMRAQSDDSPRLNYIEQTNQFECSSTSSSSRLKQAMAARF